MPTLAANQSITVNLPAGQILRFDTIGQGIVTLQNREQVEVGKDQIDIGPFNFAQILSISAQSMVRWNQYDYKPNAEGNTDLMVGGIASDNVLTNGQFATVKSVANIWAFRNEALVRLVTATPSFNQSSGLSSLDWCSAIKHEMEAPFVGVRLLKANRANVPHTGDQAVVGVSDTVATDTNANLASPRINGISYQQLAPAGTQNGWRSVTWGGASTVSTPSSVSGPQISLSDWIPLQSVSRASGEPSTRPVLMWRHEHLGSVNGAWAFSTPSTTIASPQAAMRGRVFVCSRHQAGGAIADLSNAKTFSLNATSIDVWPIVRFDRPVFSVWGVGDSITACTGLTVDRQSAWGHRACCDVSTPELPVVWANLGAASMTSADFWTNAKAHLAAGVPAPSMLVLNVASINEYNATPDVRKAEICRNVLQEGVSICRQYNIPFLVVWGTMPNENIATAPLDKIRKDTNADLKATADRFQIIWMDTSDLGDGTTPEKWVTPYKFDAYHPNENAIENVLAPRLANIIRKCIGIA